MCVSADCCLAAHVALVSRSVVLKAKARRERYQFHAYKGADVMVLYPYLTA